MVYLELFINLTTIFVVLDQDGVISVQELLQWVEERKDELDSSTIVSSTDDLGQDLLDLTPPPSSSKTTTTTREEKKQSSN